MKRLTIRLRLTVLYGGLFCLAGAMMLGVTYLLVEQSLEGRVGAALERWVPPEMVERIPDSLADDEALRAELLERARTEEQRFRQQALESVLTQGGIALGGVGVIALGFGWLLAGRALAPVHRITDTARRIAASSAGRGLHERIALDGPRDEVRELADTFDAMLERLDRSFDGQRRFVANASHEIRTPLALNRALVEVAMTRPGASEDVKQLGEALLAVNERHERLIDGLLTLAESESDIAERSPVDLSDVAAHVLDRVVPASIGASGQLHPAPTAGDPILLERLVHNLVENAIRYNLGDGGWLSVVTATADGRATLTVSNPGPAVTPYEIPVLFEPFRRRSRDHSDGAARGVGLGLSIVRAIARAHGGEVSAEARDGGGLIVTVRLPLASSTESVTPAIAPAA